MKRILLGLAIVVGVALGAAPPAHARSFSIDSVVVDATVRPDGAMNVTEHLTYDFNGDYRGGDRSIPAGDYYQIVDMRASENGVPVVVLDSDPAHFSFDSPNAPITGIHTFDISYTVVGAVQVGPDVGELYWKFIGTDFPHLDHVHVGIQFPSGSGTLLAWAHGPRQGVVQPTGDTVTLDVNDVPAGHFVEARVAAPADRFTAKPVGGPRLPTIEAQEAKLRRDTENHKKRVRTANYVSPFLAIGGFFGFLAIWRTWGKEPERPADIGEYFRDVPEEPPAVIQAFEGWGTVPRTAFSSTLVDLAQRGFLTITESVHERLGPDKVEFTFTETGMADDGKMTDFERSVMRRLFSSSSTITQDELVHEATHHRTEAVAWWNSYAKEVKANLDSRHYFNEKGRFRPYCLHGLLTLVLGLAGVLMVANGAAGGAILIAIAVVLGLLTGLLRQRTPEGTRKLAEIKGLRKFLKDFSRLNEAVAGDVVLYERYLVYAVALGVAKELMQGLQARVPDLSNQPTFAAWYVGSNVGGSRFDSLATIGSFANNFTSSTSSAFAPVSSGGGGGFSGGGGGGGGGGGAGAH